MLSQHTHTTLVPFALKKMVVQVPGPSLLARKLNFHCMSYAGISQAPVVNPVPTTGGCSFL